MPRLRPAALLLASLATLLLASTVQAHIVPVLDLRQLHAKATTAYGPPKEITLFPASFAAFNESPVAEAFGDPSGSASASAYQNSQMYRDIGGNPSGFFFAGATSGQFQVEPGSYQALSLATMVFQLTVTSDVFIDATLDPGDPGSEGEITIGHPMGGPTSLQVLSGHITQNFRLGPGDYFIEGRSQVSTDGESMAGPAYAIFMTAAPTNFPYTTVQPSDITIPPGGSGNLTATIGSPAPSPTQEGTTAFTFQWKKNGVPMANGGHYSGVTTNVLSITNAAMADTGWYQLIVTSGSISEPTRIARVNIGVVGVEPGPMASLDFRLDGAAPNPSGATTSFRFSAPHPVRADAAVHDASGRRVKTVTSGMLSTGGVLTWDGRSETGEHAPAGIYFLRVRVEGETFVRRFVRMRS